MRDYEQIIRELVRRGDEAPKIDFKRTLDLEDKEVLVDLAKTVLAIANTDSFDLENIGFVIIGAKKGELVGGADQFAKDDFCASLPDKLATYIDPPPALEIKGFRDTVVGFVAAIVVLPSPPEQRPHFIKKEYQTDPKKAGGVGRVVIRRHECYVRRGEQVALASPMDFERMYRARYGRVHVPKPRVRWLVDGEHLDAIRIPPRRQAVVDDPGLNDPFATEELAAATPTFRERAEQYNGALATFFGRWADYDKSMQPYRIVDTNGNFFSLSLSNDGEASLEHPTIRINFPDAFVVFDSKEALDERPERPLRPNRPRPPLNGLAQLFESMGLTKIMEGAHASQGGWLLARPELISPPFHTLEIETKTGTVMGSARALLHGVDPLEFETEVLLVPTEAARPGEYTVNYYVHAENLPQPFKGSLTLIVDEAASLVGVSTQDEADGADR